MMRPRLNKVLHDLWGNRARSLLVVASIAIGLIAVGVISTIRVGMSADMAAGYQAVNPAQIQIATDKLFVDGVVDHVLEMKGVRQAEAVRQFSRRLQTGPESWTAIDM